MMMRYLLAALAFAAIGAHAQTITNLTAGGAVSGADLFESVQSGNSRKVTATQIKTFTSDSPTLVTPVLGVAAATSINKVTVTAPATGATLTIADGKTLTGSNTLTFAGTDGSTLNIGAGGTLGTLATQSGTFSGTSSGINTGDQTTVSGNAGTATALQTARAIYGNNFDGSAALTQIIASTFGGTGNGFTKFSGPTTAERTFTLPDADATILYSGGAGGTPSSLTGTNITGTAAGLTAGNVTTNANLTGDVTSSGNATTLATVNGNVGSFTNSSITVNGKGLITAASSGAAGAVLTANSFTDTQTITKSIAATSTDGAVLQNTTAAAAGAQQWSPRLRLTGQGWKTDATAASQAVDWAIENVPGQAGAAPTSKLVFSSQVNGGGYTQRFSVDSGGGISIGVVGSSPTVNLSAGPFNGELNITGTLYVDGNNNYSSLKSTGRLAWSSTTTVNGSADLFLSRGGAAATLQSGSVDVAGAPVAQTFRAQSASGVSNTAGADWKMQASAGTGDQAGGAWILQVAPLGASGSTKNAYVDAVKVSTTALTLSTVVTPASSGTRFLCISTAGVVTSSASACSGT